MTYVVEHYLSQRVERLRKPSTAVLYRGYLRLHIEPVIGAKKAWTLTRADVARLHKAVGARHPTTANRVVVMLSAALSFGQRDGLVPADWVNPAQRCDRYRESLRERFLTEDEFQSLGQTLRLAETAGLPWEPDPKKQVKHAPRSEHRRVQIDPFAIAAIRLLLFTGARLREILHLQWSQIDMDRGIAFLSDSKTGRKPLILGSAALSVLAGLPRVGAFVVAGQSRVSSDGQIIEAPRSDLNRPWSRIRRHAGLEDLRLHDLRHTFASVGVSSGVGLYMVGRLLSHSSPSTTKRYAHLADDPVRRASDAISESVALALAGRAGVQAGAEPL